MFRIFLSIIPIINFILFAAPIDNQKAREVAESFLSAKSLNDRDITSINIYTKDNADIFYYINFEPKGFVLISSDDRITPLLGYGLDNEFTIENIVKKILFILSL